MVLPLLFQLAARKRDLESLHRARRLAHRHFYPPQIRRVVVRQTPFAGLLADDERPLVWIRYIREQRIVARRNVQTPDVEIGIRMQGGGGVGARAPDRIVRVVRNESAIPENLP